MDEAFKSFAQIVEDLMSFGGVLVDDDAGVRMFIDACSIDTPVELDVSHDADGKLVIGTTPPLYPLMTTIGPVFHRIRFRASLTADRTGDNDG